ncbi:hypothetical protein C7M84_019665 [Penaeus vannamei]|uniref:Uncharacterized protein n=1 Tax=Penaeus vannamei TaxID=6689 RepID=A0A423SE82_PENVA|nr:hypothetical protein C7M84_019665 [Penaeus vannamei]
MRSSELCRCRFSGSSQSERGEPRLRPSAPRSCSRFGVLWCASAPEHAAARLRCAALPEPRRFTPAAMACCSCLRMRREGLVGREPVRILTTFLTATSALTARRRFLPLLPLCVDAWAVSELPTLTTSISSSAKPKKSNVSHDASHERTHNQAIHKTQTAPKGRRPPSPKAHYHSPPSLPLTLKRRGGQGYAPRNRRRRRGARRLRPIRPDQPHPAADDEPPGPLAPVSVIWWACTQSNVGLFTQHVTARLSVIGQPGSQPPPPQSSRASLGLEAEGEPAGPSPPPPGARVGSFYRPSLSIIAITTLASTPPAHTLLPPSFLDPGTLPPYPLATLPQVLPLPPTVPVPRPRPSKPTGEGETKFVIRPSESSPRT